MERQYMYDIQALTNTNTNTNSQHLLDFETSHPPPTLLIRLRSPIEPNATSPYLAPGWDANVKSASLLMVLHMSVLGLWDL